VFGFSQQRNTHGPHHPIGGQETLVCLPLKTKENNNKALQKKNETNIGPSNIERNCFEYIKKNKRCPIASTDGI
jgi:hypothetical protein